ncbi:MAG: amino acid permease, partial [Dysgonamonadaceae bacterium]|nr:amino acid permease [Dysgonamonadaceae bacterium]
MSIFQRKPVLTLLSESQEEGSHTLRKTLGPVKLIALGLGAIIGAGLFSITGIAAGSFAGPSITISFLIAAVGCCFAGLCYAEFASMLPVAGSAYTYSYATLGEFIAWVIGWDLILEYAVASATVSISWSRYLVKLLENFQVHLPVELTACPWEGGIINLPAALIVILMSLLLIRGTEKSSFVNILIVILKVAVVISFIVIGWKFIRSDNYVPYIPENT